MVSKVKEQLKRQWRILKMIPPYKKGITRGAIQQRLFGPNADPALTRQTQRDLEQLKEIIDEIHIDDNNGGYRAYSWGENGPPVFLGGMSVNETLAFGVLKQIGVEWMPNVLQKALEPFFKQALDEAAELVGGFQGLTKRQSNSLTNRWLKKVHYIQAGIAFKAHPINEIVELEVHEALLNETCLEIEYRETLGQVLTLIISPQVLVRRGVRTYLYAKPRGVNKVEPYSMYRILSAKKTMAGFEYAKDFNLQESLKAGVAFREFADKEYGKLVKLKLWVDQGTANWINNTPLSDDQSISPVGGGAAGFYLQASVPVQEELIWWLRSMGGNIQVLGPKLIANRIKDDLKKALNRYQ